MGREKGRRKKEGKTNRRTGRRERNTGEKNEEEEERKEKERSLNGSHTLSRQRNVRHFQIRMWIKLPFMHCRMEKGGACNRLWIHVDEMRYSRIVECKDEV